MGGRVVDNRAGGQGRGGGSPGVGHPWERGSRESRAWPGVGESIRRGDTGNTGGLQGEKRGAPHPPTTTANSTGCLPAARHGKMGGRKGTRKGQFWGVGVGDMSWGDCWGDLSQGGLGSISSQKAELNPLWEESGCQSCEDRGGMADKGQSCRADVGNNQDRGECGPKTGGGE